MLLNKLRKMREKKGFTLVELIVVIAIIGILAAILIPLIGDYLGKAKDSALQSDAKALYSATVSTITEIRSEGGNVSDLKYNVAAGGNPSNIVMTISGSSTYPGTSFTITGSNKLTSGGIIFQAPGTVRLWVGNGEKTCIVANGNTSLE